MADCLNFCNRIENWTGRILVHNSIAIGILRVPEQAAFAYHKSLASNTRYHAAIFTPAIAGPERTANDAFLHPYFTGF